MINDNTDRPDKQIAANHYLHLRMFLNHVYGVRTNIDIKPGIQAQLIPELANLAGWSYYII